MSGVRIRMIEEPDARWDATIAELPGRSIFHASAWTTIWRELYGRESVGFLAIEGTRILAALPLTRIRRPWSRAFWCSMPFFDAAGPIGDEEGIATILHGVEDLVRERRDQFAELRMARAAGWDIPIVDHKVHVTLELPQVADDLLSGFKKKVRNQVRRSLREEFAPVHGGTELVDEFHAVYVARMRDLVSPPHGAHFFRRVLRTFPDAARIVVLRDGARAVAGAFLIQDGDRTCVPWAATLREALPRSANMALYYELLRSSAERGSLWFDFGRSNAGSTQLKFKLQWGGVETPLFWYRVGDAAPGDDGPSAHAPRQASAVLTSIWRHLPIPVVRFVGGRAIRYFA